MILCPVWAAKVANSVLNNLVREPFEPPPSAVISNLDASGKAWTPTACHQRRIVSTANAAVSWSVPTLTQPVIGG